MNIDFIFEQDGKLFYRDGGCRCCAETEILDEETLNDYIVDLEEKLKKAKDLREKFFGN